MIFNRETLNSAIVLNNNNTIRNIMVIDYRCCYVKDYMTSCIGELVLILVPQSYIDNNFSMFNMVKCE